MHDKIGKVALVTNSPIGTFVDHEVTRGFLLEKVHFSPDALDSTTLAGMWPCSTKSETGAYGA